MSGGHTPGPWIIARSRCGYPYQIDAPNGSKGPGGIRSVTRWAAISMPSSREGEANARLIAAAPEGLAANREAVDFLQSYFGPVDGGDAENPRRWSDGYAFDVWSQLRAAIAKASKPEPTETGA